MAIGLSHGGTTIYSSESPSKEVWVGTKEGVVAIERDDNGDGISIGMFSLSCYFAWPIAQESENN